jgi:hypothetical protein
MGPLVFLILSLHLQAQMPDSKTNPQFHSLSYQVWLADVDNRTKTFVINVPNKINPRGYKMLDRYLRNGVVIDEHGNPHVGVILGDITTARPTIHHKFHFQYIVQSVRWNDFATQVCDARLRDVENNLKVWLKRRLFCPWTTPSLVVKILKNNQLMWERPVSEQ